MYTREFCTRSHVEVSASWVVGSSPCWCVPRRSFHTDVCDDNIACTIFVVGALAATIVGMMFVECFYMVGIIAVCQALALVLQQVVVWCLASNSDTSFAPRASILVGLGGLEKAFLTKDTEGTEVRPVVRAVDAGLFDFFFGQTNCQPKCFVGLSTDQVRAAIECPKGPRVRLHRCTRGSCFTRSHFEVSASLGCGFESLLVCSTSEFPRRRSQCLHTAGALA